MCRTSFSPRKSEMERGWFLSREGSVRSGKGRPIFSSAAWAEKTAPTRKTAPMAQPKTVAARALRIIQPFTVAQAGVGFLDVEKILGDGLAVLRSERPEPTAIHPRSELGTAPPQIRAKKCKVVSESRRTS